MSELPLYALKLNIEDAYKGKIYNRNLGFIWILELVNLLGAYENSQESFPTFRSLFPLIISYFDEFSKRIEREAKVFEQKSPHVIGVIPISNSSQNVNPDISNIVLTFDKPLDNKKVNINEPSNSKDESSHMVKQLSFL